MTIELAAKQGDEETLERVRRRLYVDFEGNDGTVSLKTREELIGMTSLLKLSNSITAELIPGDDNYLDKKVFVWSLF